MRRWLIFPVLLSLASLAIPATATDRDEVEDRITELASLIRDQEGRKSEIQAEITGAERQMAEIRVRLAEAQTRLGAIQAEIETTSETAARLQRGTQLLERQLAETRIELRTTRMKLRDQAVELYVRGSVPGIVFDQDDVTEVAVGLSYAREAAADLGALIRALEVLKAQEEQQQSELEEQKAEIVRQLDRLEERRAAAAKEEAEVLRLEADVEAQLEDHRDLLARVERQIEEYESEKQLAAAELAALEADIRSRSSEEGTTPGRLRWPIAATVSSHFGPRLHPIFGTTRLHAGIDLRASAGTAIGAAGSGRVILAGLWGGYGNTVVIDHGGGLTTLYAHQSSLAVSVGEVVEAGQRIGYVGNTGFSTGPHLHFETRENGVPVDPMRYLG